MTGDSAGPHIGAGGLAELVFHYLTVTAGWLASLMAISAADLGEHAAAIIWCTDTERHGRDAAYPELPGWAALTRSLIAWYQGDPLASAAAGLGGLPVSVLTASDVTAFLAGMTGNAL